MGQIFRYFFYNFKRVGNDKKWAVREFAGATRLVGEGPLSTTAEMSATESFALSVIVKYPGPLSTVPVVTLD